MSTTGMPVPNVPCPIHLLFRPCLLLRLSRVNFYFMGKLLVNCNKKAFDNANY